MLDLDEMKAVWAGYDRRLEESVRLNWQLLSTMHLNGARSALQRTATAWRLEALGWLTIVIALGSFIYEHAGTLRFALPGGALDLFAIGMLAATIRQVVAIQQIDYARPIVAIQKQLAALRVMRIRTIQRGMLAGTVVWAALPIVVWKVLFGIDGYNVGWLVANVLFGLSLIPLALWVSRKFGDRMDRSPFVQRLMKDIAGDNLNAAGAFIEKLSEFENEKRAG